MAVTCQVCATPLDVPDDAQGHRLCIGCYRKCLKPCPECMEKSIGGKHKIIRKYQNHVCTGTAEFPCPRCGAVTAAGKSALLCPVCKNERWLLKIPQEKQGCPGTTPSLMDSGTPATS